MIFPINQTFRFGDLFALEQIYNTKFNPDYVLDLNADGWRIEYDNRFIALYDDENHLRFFGIYENDYRHPVMGITFWNFNYPVRQAFLHIVDSNNDTLYFIIQLTNLLLTDKYLAYHNIHISKMFDKHGSPEYTLNPTYQRLIDLRIDELMNNYNDDNNDNDEDEDEDEDDDEDEYDDEYDERIYAYNPEEYDW